jgi:prenylcysteine oxidase/farnesylcysteine lyase
VHAYDDPSTRAIELGASIFVQANKNMWRAAEEFNLSRVDFEDEDSVTGVWDGQKFIVKVRARALRYSQLTLHPRWATVHLVGGTR